MFVWGTGGRGGGTTALPGSFTASGRRGERGGGRELPRLLGDRSVNGRGIRVHARWRGRAFTRGRAPARHPSGIHDPDTHAAVGQDHSQSNQACGLVRGRSFRGPHHEHPGCWRGFLSLVHRESKPESSSKDLCTPVTQSLMDGGGRHAATHGITPPTQSNPSLKVSTVTLTRVMG